MGALVIRKIACPFLPKVSLSKSILTVWVNTNPKISYLANLYIFARHTLISKMTHAETLLGPIIYGGFGGGFSLP